MDAINATKFPDFNRALEAQKTFLQHTERLKGKQPEQKYEREQSIFRFLGVSAMSLNRSTTSYFLTRAVFIPPAYPPCTSPLSELKKVLLRDLRLETHHRGNYIILRTITHAVRMTNLTAIVEDETQDVVTLELWYQPEENEISAFDILPEGTVLVVKEPYLYATADAVYGIHIDHLSNVSFDACEVTPKHWKQQNSAVQHSANDLKLVGNENFRKSKFLKAIDNYTQGMIYSENEEDTTALRLNRSLAYINTYQFDAALVDVDFSPKTSKHTEKALFRKAKALYGLHRYQNCTEVLKLLCMTQHSQEAKSELNRAMCRLAEQRTGTYKFNQFYKETTDLLPPHLDHSTFIGSVEVRLSESRGRGLFTTATVKAGELLLCEKAFAHAHYDRSKGPDGQINLLVMPEIDHISYGTYAALSAMIIRKLHRNSSLSSTITDLHHGSYQSGGMSDTSDKSIVDSFLVQCIVSLNSFGCPLSSREIYLGSLNNDANDKARVGDGFRSCGLWPKASYINHCCYSNARRSFIGDMMIVRATQDLPPDTEITFWYQIPTYDGYSDRQKKFRQWNFHCDCSMCENDQQTDETIIAKRKSLRALVEKDFRSGKNLINTTRIENMLSMIAKTYTEPASAAPRLVLWDLYLETAQVHMSRRRPNKALEFALKCLTSLGYEIESGENTVLVIRKWGLMQEKLIQCWMLIRFAYNTSGRLSCELQAYQYAKISYRICIGEDETFEEIYGTSQELPGFH